MNACVLVGRIGKYPGEIRATDRGTRFIICGVEYEKVFPGGKKFTTKFKVFMFGNAIDEVAPKLKPGTLVCVTGEVSLDIPKDERQNKHANLKLTGQISVLQEAAAPKPASEPARAPEPPAVKEQDGSPTEDDPF